MLLRIAKYLKSKRWVLGVLALLLTASVVLPIALFSGGVPAAAGTIAGNPITDIPGELDLDVSSLNWTTQNYQKFNDQAWSGINQIRSTNNPEYGPFGPAGPSTTVPIYGGTSAYFNVYTTINPVTPYNPYGPNVPTLDHILFYPPDDTAVPPRVAKVGFYGYSQAHFFDYVYTEDYNIYSIDFDVNPAQWNFHCLKRNGFMIKCKETKGPTPNEDTISGYILSMGGSNAFLGEDTSNVDTPNTNIYLYYVENMRAAKYQQAVAYGSTPVAGFNASAMAWTSRTAAQWQAIGVPAAANGAANAAAIWAQFADAATSSSSASPGAGTGLPRGSAAPVLIPKLTSTPQFGAATPQMHFHFEMVKDPVTQQYTNTFRIYYTPNSAGMTEQQLIANRILLYEVDMDAVPGRVNDGRGFGLYMQSRYHSCMRLTATEFSNFGLKVENEDPTVVHAQVNYKIFGTNTQIAPADTSTSYLGSYYTVDPLAYCRVIEDTVSNKKYYYFSADRTLYEPDGVTPLAFYYEEDDPLSPGVAPLDNTINLFYIEEPTIKKNAVVMEKQGSGPPYTYTADPGGIDNGAPTAPRSFPYDDRLEYTVTIFNPNLEILAGPAMQLIDLLPPGLRYVSTVSPYPAPVVTPHPVRNQEVLTWDVSSIPANDGTKDGEFTVKIIVSVEPNGYGMTFVNGADLYAPDTALNITSNRTYHKADLAPATGEKEARILDTGTGTYPGSPSNGMPGSRVELGRSDTLKYTINVNNPNPPYHGNRYDVIYVLDWSESMEGTSSTPNFRLVAKDVAEKFSRKVFDTYPGSRVALMGMNVPGVHNNAGQPALLNVQVDTPFCEDADYASIIATAYPSAFDYKGDDDPLFLQAAIDKQLGLFNGYGGGTPTTLVFPEAITPVPATTVDARLDESRVPVIIQVSDWQLAPNPPYDPYNTDPWGRMQTQMQRFKTARGDGVFIGVGFVGNDAANYNAPATGNLAQLTSRVRSIGGTDSSGNYRWGVVDAQARSNADEVADLLWAEFTAKAPLDPGSGTITDTLPPGLETPTDGSGVTVRVNGVAVSPPDIDVDITVDAQGQYVVTVEFHTFPSGTISVDIICTVESGDLDQYELDNTAHVEYTFEGKTGDLDTNTTYHKIPTYNVTTRWVECFTSPPSASELGKTDLIKPVIRGNTYYVPAGPSPAEDHLAAITYTKPGDISRNYEYYGYSTDGGATVVPGPPPTTGFVVTGDLTIVLYFRTTYKIVEKFHWDLNPYTEIWSDLAAKTVYSGDSWTPSGNGGPFPNDSGGTSASPQSRWIGGYLYTWAANQYKRELDTAAHTAWTTGLTNIQGDHAVIYPYSRGEPTSFKVTEEFRKIEDPMELIAADKTTMVPGGGDFSPSARPAATAPNEYYVYVGYQIDGGSIVFDNPPDPLLTYVTADHTITYLYAKMASKNARVYHNGEDPPDAMDPGTVMVPVIARPGDPTIPTADDEIEYFIYLELPKAMQDPSETITVTDELPKGLKYLSSNVTPDVVPPPTNPVTNRTTVTWTVPADFAGPITVRVQVIERPPPTAAFVNQALITLNDRPHIPRFPTNPTFHSNILPGERMLHIRQIILTRSPAAPYAALPPVGFFEMRNNGRLTDLLSTSGLLGTIVPFTIYTLPDSADTVYLLKNIVPQFYEWKDYELTALPILHDRTTGLRTDRVISIDYQDEREYWLTVYLTPRPLTGQHSWDFRTNVVGRIYYML